MTSEDVAAGVETVRARAEAGDFEAAHSAEDGLHLAVLKAIADGASDASLVASVALQTVGIDFPRYRA